MKLYNLIEEKGLIRYFSVYGPFRLEKCHLTNDETVHYRCLGHIYIDKKGKWYFNAFNPVDLYSPDIEFIFECLKKLNEEEENDNRAK
jgi:hypothetical protein